MERDEATAVLALVRAWWPHQSLPESTQVVWGETLLHYELVDASSAVETLGRLGTFMPSFSELEDAIIEERNARVRLMPALPVPAGVHHCDKPAPGWCGTPGHCCWHEPCGGPGVAFKTGELL